MTLTMLPVALATTGAAAILNLWLGWRVDTSIGEVLKRLPGITIGARNPA